MHLLYMCLLKIHFRKHAVTHDRFVMDAVIIPKLTKDRFFKLAVAHDKYVVDAVIILTLVAEME